MRIPEFIKINKLFKEFSNLQMNCDTAQDMYNCLFELCAKSNSLSAFNVQDINDCAQTFTAANEYTMLSPYYFVASKNDPENELKALLTRTYTSRREYTSPLKGL